MHGIVSSCRITSPLRRPMVGWNEERIPPFSLIDEFVMNPKVVEFVPHSTLQI